MIALEHVKRRLRRRIVAVATGIAATGVLTMGIVAFLGRHVGTFTIALDTAHVELSLSKTSDFAESSSFLWIDKMYPFEEFEYIGFEHYPNVDSEETDYLYGANVNPETEEVINMNFFKYTFFLKNVGMTPAMYKMKILIYSETPSNDGRFVSDTLRIQLYANDADSDKHESTIYAKENLANEPDEDGNRTRKEYVYGDPDSGHYLGLCEKFKSDSEITTYSPESIFARDDVTRFTLVAWLDGNDFQSEHGMSAPIGATIRLGVEINAYETE